MLGFGAAILIWGGAAVGGALADNPGERLLSDGRDLIATAEAQVSQGADDANDPLEGLNRRIFNFNEGLQEAVLRPIAETYNETVPANGRRALKNAFDNLSEPITFVNNILQGEFERAINTFVRAMINTVFGAAGLMDVAGEMGLESQSEDFGQTLGVWGVGEGFYLVLPVLGPSSPRDALGRFLVDSYFDPLGHYLENIDETEIDIALDVVDGILEYADVVEELDQIKKTSVDYYAAIRSLYRQKRRAEISNGENIDLPPIPDISPEIRGGVPPTVVQDGPIASLDQPKN